MKIIAPLLFGLLLIAPAVQASEVTDKPKTEAETKALVAAETVHALQRGQADREVYTRLFTNAVVSEDAEMATALSPHADIKEINAIKPHPLFVIKNSKIISLLLAHADPNMKNDGRETLLIHYCTRVWRRDSVHEDNVKLLLAQPGIRVNESDGFGSAIHKLVPEGNIHTSLIQELLNHNADPYIPRYTQLKRTETGYIGVGKGTTLTQAINSLYWLDSTKKSNIIALCVESHAKAVLEELRKYLFKDPAAMAVDYIWEDYEREAVEASKKQTKE